MSPVHGSARELREMAEEGTLALRLAKQVKVSYRASDLHGEVGSWKRSLPALLDVLIAAGLSHAQVIPEHRLPYSPRRIDAVICGTHPDHGKRSYVLVELKQWSYPRSAGYRLVRMRDDDDQQPELHPAEQVRRYCRQLLDFTPELARQPGSVKGMAYLHNATRTPEWDLDDFDFDDFGQLYTLDQVTDLVADLHELIDSSPAAAAGARQAAESFLGFRAAPARTLMTSAAALLHDREEFILLDEQQVALELVMDAVRQEHSAAKRVVVVRGGPGSGKSAIALTLLAKLARQNRKVLHATGSKAFTETLRQQTTGHRNGSGRVRGVFTYFNEYGSADQDSLDVLICDEAQRIRGNPNMPPDRLGRYGQIVKLIQSAKVPVFLLDDDQVIRPRESGTPQEIVATAQAMGCNVVEVNLEGQFRCGGSPRFDAWVRRLLGITAGGPVVWSELVDGTDEEYVVDSVRSPHELESWLRRQMKDSEDTARIAAGFCWPWSDPKLRDGRYELVDDVTIGGWRKPWNTKQGYDVPDMPPSSLWATDPAGFGQVGCIYTAQGFEYEWAGVIFGKDLVIRDGHWVGYPRESADDVMANLDPDQFIILARNTYKVLMTRGLNGVCLYSEDEQTNAFLRKFAS